MPAYKLNSEEWVSHQARIVKAVLRENMDPDESYTPQEILDLLATFGLVYSNPEYLPVGNLLIAQGFLEVI